MCSWGLYMAYLAFILDWYRTEVLQRVLPNRERERRSWKLNTLCRAGSGLRQGIRVVVFLSWHHNALLKDLQAWSPLSSYWRCWSEMKSHCGSSLTGLTSPMSSKRSLAEEPTHRGILSKCHSSIYRQLKSFLKTLTENYKEGTLSWQQNLNRATLILTLI